MSKYRDCSRVSVNWPFASFAAALPVPRRRVPIGRSTLETRANNQSTGRYRNAPRKREVATRASFNVPLRQLTTVVVCVLSQTNEETDREFGQCLSSDKEICVLSKFELLFVDLSSDN